MLAADRAGHVSPQPRRLAMETGQNRRQWSTGRRHHMDQQMSAARRSGHLLDEYLVEDGVRPALGEREVQRSLYLPAQLPRLVLSMPAGRSTFPFVALQRRRKLLLFNR